MKRLFAFLICAVLLSCETEQIFNPPYQSEWYAINETSRDIQFHIVRKFVLDSKENVYYDRCLLPRGDKFYQDFRYNRQESQKFVSLFLFQNAGELLSCKVYLTPIDSDEVLKEWVLGEDNGEHDIFDESQWEHKSWEDNKSASYTIYHNEWTFTITDADIGEVE